MTDLELTRLCAEAMGYATNTDPISMAVAGQLGVWTHEHGYYDPLRSDAQAMALVKRLGLWIKTWPHHGDDGWMAGNDDETIMVGSDGLNRAIVECVAKMHEKTISKDAA